ncbi:jg27485, partial [Pararge aegeria aegeria]
MQQDVFIYFIDYEKAFDRVKHDRLGPLLRNIGLDGKDLRIVLQPKGTVRIRGEVSKEVEIQKGVRQGCILSPVLFNLYSEAVMAEALEDLNCGVKINGRIINNLRYADETIFIASTETELQRIVDRVNKCSKEAGLTINIKKTKVLVVSNNANLGPTIRVASQVLERVQRYKYLGTWLTEKWDSETEIKTRIEKLKLTLFSEETKEFFVNLVLSTMKDREARKIIRPDMIHLLMEAKK